MKIECRDLKPIRLIKSTLQVAMLVLVLLNLYLAVMATARNMEKLTSWERHPAEVISLAGETDVEIEVPVEFADALPGKKVPEYCFAYQPGNTCLLVPANPYAWLSVFDPVEVLQNPVQRAQLEILSMTGFWLPVAGHLLAVLLLAAAWRWLGRSGWGEDRTWKDGAWVATVSAPQRIGFGGMDAEPVIEASSSRKAVVFWNVLFLIIAAMAVPEALSHFSDDPLQAVWLTAGGLGMWLLALYGAVKTFSRRIYQDPSGLLDCSFFGINRVSWSAVVEVKLVNLNRAAQRRYDRRHSFNEERPVTLEVYMVSDRHGREILRLSETMAPAAAFNALLARLQRQSNQGVRLAEGQHETLAHPDPIDSRAGAQVSVIDEWERMTASMQGQRKSLFHRDHRSLLAGLSLMLAPFVLGTAYLVYQSLWFQYGAEHTQGKIVEIKQGELPSLVVEYRPVQGKPLRIESDGSGAYAGYKIGDALSVYYAVDDPENARIGLFLELWLGTLIVGGLTAIVLAAAVLIGRQLTLPMPRM